MIFFEAGGSAASRLKISEKQLDALYVLAVRRYQNKQFKDALPIFLLLVQLDSLNVLYAKGLGATLQELQNYEKAVLAYSLAIALDALDAQTCFHAAQCFYFMGNFDKAEYAIKSAQIAANHNKEKFGTFLAKINDLGTRIESKKEAGNKHNKHKE